MLSPLDSPQKEDAGCGKCHLIAQACWDMWDVKSMRISCETDICHSPCKQTQARNTSLLCVLGKMQTQAQEWAPKNGELAISEKPPQRPARLSCYSPPAGSEGMMCCLRSTALPLKHRVLPGGTWPRRAAECCNRRALRCPGKRLLSLSHTCVGEGPRACQSL